MHCDYIFFPDHQTRPHKSSYWLISRSFDQPNITQSRAGVRKIFSGKYFLNYSSPPQLRYIPPITLFSQLRYFELGPKKLELKLFSPQLRYFFPPSYTIFPPSCAIFFFFPPVTLFSSVTGGKKKKIAQLGGKIA